MLWQIISATPVRCANHSKCSASGLCNWVGTYGGFQQHIRTCTNTPLQEFSEPVAQPAAQEAGEEMQPPVQEVSEEEQPAVNDASAAEVVEEAVPPGDWEDRDEEQEVEEADEPTEMRRSESFASDPEEGAPSELEEEEVEGATQQRRPPAPSPGTQLANDLSNLGDELAGDFIGEGLGLTDEAGDSNLTDLIRQLFDSKVESHQKESPGSSSTNGSSYESGSSHGSAFIMEAASEAVGAAEIVYAPPGQEPTIAGPPTAQASKFGKQKTGKNAGNMGGSQGVAQQQLQQAHAKKLQAAWAHATQAQAQAQYYTQLQYHYQMAQWQQARSAYAGQVANQLRAAAWAAKQQQQQQQP